MSQTGLTADPAASSSDAVNCSTFSAAAEASDGRTVAGSAAVVVTVVGSGSASTITRNAGSFSVRFFGILPWRRLSASTSSSKRV